MREIAVLFAVFAKIGCVSFGGGYAMLPILERELIVKRQWATLDEIMRYYTISQITPGIIAVNVASFIGYKRKKIAGGIAATLGFVMPSATMVVIIASAIKNFAELPLVRHAFNGLKIAVGALVLDTVVKLIKKIPQKDASFTANLIAALIFAASFLVSLIWQTNPVFIVAAAGLAGFLFFKR
ncbi:MAG: chromate transporter [Termitinemataceae bacterium]|nr:MAG: chromate transporter [Termitinemataceae bacterium]